MNSLVAQPLDAYCSPTATIASTLMSKSNAPILPAGAGDHHISDSDKRDATNMASNGGCDAGSGPNGLEQEAAMGKVSDQTLEEEPPYQQASEVEKTVDGTDSSKLSKNTDFRHRARHM